MGFVLVFAGGALTFAAASEWLVRTLVAPIDQTEKYKARLLGGRAAVVAFGDSHVDAAIAPDGVVLNLAHGGETLPLMVRKLRAVVSSGRAQRVAVQFSPQQFAIYRADKRQDEMADEFFDPATPSLQFMRPHFRRYLLDYWKSVLNDPSRLIVRPKATAQPPTPAPQSDARFIDLPAAEQRKIAEIRVQLHAPLPSGDAVNRLFGELFAALADARKRGVEPCVVQYPLSSVYRQATQQVKSYETLKASLRAQAQARDIRFVDLTAGTPDGHFADPDHIAAAARDAVTDAMLTQCFGSVKASRSDFPSPQTSRAHP